MDNIELLNVLAQSISSGFANMHTSTVAKITAVSEKTINCAPVINRIVGDESVRLPEFIEVPPVFLHGGTSYTAHPIAVGDYCLLIFTERCFDRWYAGQDFELPAEFRMHDYSDGFALVGVVPQASAITIPSVITQVGDTYQNGDYEHDGDREQTGNYDLDGNQTVTGTLGVDGAVTLNLTLSVTGQTTLGSVSFTSIQSPGGPGASGTFQEDGGGTITVNNGIITGGLS